jgi:predicted nucleic acid-binding protein
VITLDVSAAVALLVRDRPEHAQAVGVLAAARQDVVVPLGLLALVDHVVAGPRSTPATLALLDGIQRGDTFLDPGDLDLPRIRELMARCGDPPLRLADASVIACAERNGGAVLSFERRALSVAARDLPISLLP